MPRVMEIVTPLGEDLLFHAMHGREELGRISEFQVDLLSPKKSINFDDILGKNVTIKLVQPDDSVRYFNGIVGRVSQGAMVRRYYKYSATVRSWLWLLTRTTDCKIFQDMTVPDIIKKVFGDHKAADFAFELTGSYRKWTYCVQYRETDFNFISRLMEEEGMYYYTRHSEGHNTVVITDSTSKHSPVPKYETIPFISPEQVYRPEFERVDIWDVSREIQPGVYVHDDYDFEKPSVDLKVKKTLSRSYSPSDAEIYDYPGYYVQKAHGEHYALARIDEYGARYEATHGMTNARGLATGHTFKLKAHPRDDQNQEYLVLAAEIQPQLQRVRVATGCDAWSPVPVQLPRNADHPAVPAASGITPKPFVQGPQTAVVVGPAGEEIYTDKYGRVKVQFHWDRRARTTRTARAGSRRRSPGRARTGVRLPCRASARRSIVDFLEGDPDQPIIIGRVYNAEQMPPYDLPANKTQTRHQVA